MFLAIAKYFAIYLCFHSEMFPVITLAKILLTVQRNYKVFHAFSLLQGHDVVIQCRDEGRMRRDVYWTREGGQALPKMATMVAVLFILFRCATIS